MKLTKEKIGWGIIGPGRIGRDFAESLRLVPDAYVAAAGSRSFERSKEFCDEFGGTPYGSYEEMVQDPNVDIVYVAVPHNFHEDAVILAAKAGKHILCEKPLAVTRASAERMYAAAEEAGVYIADGLWSRYFPAWKFVRELIASGEMGKVQYVSSCTGWGCDPDLDPKNRLLDPNLAGGALLDGGLYSFTAMTVGTGLVEEPTEFFSSVQFTNTGVDGESALFLRFANGMSATLMCSLWRNDFWTTFVCENGVIQVPRHRNPDTVIVKKTPVKGYAQVKWLEETTHYFPWESKGFQYEAAAVQQDLRDGLKIASQVTKEESLMLAGWCDRVREAANFRYPFE